MRKLVMLLSVLALAAFALGACGGGDDDDEAPAPTEPPTEQPSDGGGAASTLDVSADPGGALAFQEKSLSTKAGEVEIQFDNPSSTQHDVRIEDEAGNEVGGTEVITDSSASATVSLDKGKHTFYCSVPGHREAGMEGPLTVK